MDVSNPLFSSSIVSQPEPPASAESPAGYTSAKHDWRRRLLNRIEKQSSPALPPKVWRFLGTTQSVRRLSHDASQLVASLKNEFSEGALRASRVLISRSPDALQLSAVFGDESSSFVIRRGTGRVLTDVISARGLLSDATPEWLHLAAERRDAAATRPQVVLTAFRDDEMLVLHRLRFKFTSAAGLPAITGKRVRELFTARAPHRQHHKYMLTLPGWQIANLINDPTPQIRRAIARIADIQHQYGYDPANIFSVWLPTSAEFRDICLARKFADLRLLSRALLKSLNQSQYSPADALRVISDRTETSYGVARRELERAVLSSRFIPRADEVDIALTKFWRAFQKSVVNKFLAFAGGDGWEEWRLMMAAELAKKWFSHLEIVAAAGRVLAGEYPAYRETFDADLFDLQLRIASEFARLYRLKPPGSLLRQS